METQIRFRRRIPGLKSQEIRQKAMKALKGLGCHEGELSILFTSDRHMAELNSHYLGRKGPTNVIAFPMSDSPPVSVDGGMLGDIVISVDTAIREAEQAGESIEDAINRLLIHGLLHLLHYDHERSPKEARRMKRQERRLLKLLSHKI